MGRVFKKSDGIGLICYMERDAGIDTISMPSNTCPSALHHLFFTVSYSVSYSVMLTAKL